MSTSSIAVWVEDRDGVRHQQQLQLGETLMQQLRDAGFAIEAVCGGCCSCATCHVLINHALVGPPQPLENALLSTTSDYASDRSRLSCQIQVQPGLHNTVIVIAQED